MNKSVNESERPYMWYGKFCWKHHPLYDAIRLNDTNKLRYLVEECGENVNVGQNNALIFAIECGFEHIALYILERCDDTLCPKGQPLIHAIQQGMMCTCLGILKSGSETIKAEWFKEALIESKLRFPARVEMLVLVEKWIQIKSEEDWSWLLT
jgi:hypothetical protein